MRLVRPFALVTAAAAAALLCSAAVAQTAPAKPAAKRTKATTAAPAVKKPVPATAQQLRKNEAKGLALARETTETISAGQLDVAARVLTGQADCEFNQRVVVQAVNGQPGWFMVQHRGAHYRMLPRETSTGAVRLEDPTAGIVWLQIPAKSMLMDARKGQRLIDSCMHAEQRAAVLAVADAAHSIGIVAQPAAVAAVVAPVAATSPAPSADSAAMATPAASAASAASASPAASAATAAPAASAADLPASR